MPRSVHFVKEYGTVALPLREILRAGRVDLYPEVESRGYLTARLKGDRLTFAAGGFVGFVPLNDRVALNIIPRVPIGQFTRILALSGHLARVLERAKRAYGYDPQQIPSLVDVLTSAFLSAVDVIAHLGLHHQYVQKTERTSLPRGRIVMAGTFRNQARGAQHEVVTTWHERSIDTPPNRLLKYTLRHLASHYAAIQHRSGNRKLVTNLNRLYHAFEGVGLDRDREFLGSHEISDPDSIPQAREYYRPAIELARLIVQNAGVDPISRGRIPLPSLIFDMEEAFEGYVRAVLRDQLKGSGLRVLDGNLAPPEGARKPLFDDQEGPTANPDFIVEDEDGEAVLVGDVKYKPSPPSRGDINQIITYAVTYRAKAAIVVSPAPREGHRFEELGRMAGIRIFHHEIDLAQGFEETEAALAKQVADVAGEPDRS